MLSSRTDIQSEQHSKEQVLAPHQSSYGFQSEKTHVGWVRTHSCHALRCTNPCVIVPYLRNQLLSRCPKGKQWRDMNLES